MKDLIQWISAVIVLSGGFLSFFFFWNRRLKKEIRNHKQTEKKLRASELKYRHMFYNAPVGMIEVDFRKNRFIKVNEAICRYSGYSVEALLSMDPSTLLTDESKKLYSERQEKLASGEKINDAVGYTIIRKDGSTMDVMLNSEFIYEDGRIKGAHVVIQNITDLKQAQEEKIKAQKTANEQNKMALVGQIAGKIAHDFNNILSVILGTTELSIMDCKDPEISDALRVILEQAVKGKNLTKNLAVFAKDHEPKQAFFHLRDKMDFILDLLKKDLEGIELVNKNEKEIPLLLADPWMIEHALINLIQNAIHAVSKTDHPTITITYTVKDDRICLKINDNGCGIPEEHLENIYHPSFTLKGSQDIMRAYRPEIKGTGYGMCNVKKYIEQHHGTIEVESKTGAGTTVIIQLPITREELTPEEIAVLTKENNFSEKRILLVEDEVPVSQVQFKVLTQEPCRHEVDIAWNADMAVEMFNKTTYDLISLDYILPGGKNGMDVYQEVRRKNKRIPILFISGNIEFIESIKQLKQKDPLIDHLSKPCLNREYIRIINMLFKRVSLQISPQ